MTVRNVFTAAAVIDLVFALLFILVPAQLIIVYGNTPEAPHEYTLRTLGATYLGNAILFWLARDAGPSVARRALIASGIVGLAVGVIISVAAVLTGAWNAVTWGTVVLSVVFLALFIVLWQREPQTDS